jgi:hypothetical protein
MSSVGGKTGELAIDGAPVGSAMTAPYSFSAPADLAAGMHAVTVTVFDLANREAAATVSVNVMARCDAGQSCATGHCLGGLCVPDASVPGGLGAACTEAEQCITGLCATNAGESMCTDACDAGSPCPDGFECVATSAGTACWPGDGDEGGGGGSGPLGGGCNARGGAAPGWFGLVLLGLTVARRTRQPRRRRSRAHR